MPRLAVVVLIVLVPSLSGATAGELWPGARWPTATPEEMGLDGRLLERARDYALTGAGSGCIIRGGQLVLAWGDLTQKYDLKSTTKAIGVTALGLAIQDGKIQLGDKARKHHPELGLPPPENRATGWLDDLTILHLATQTAGFDKNGGYTKLLFQPGSKWRYSDGGPNWLAECVTLAYGQDVNALLFDRVFQPIGIQETDLAWRKNAYRPDTINGIKRREFGSGISANVAALARIGYLYLRQGRWNGRELIPSSFVDVVRAPVKEVVGLPEHEPEPRGNASDHYGLLWWNNGDGTLPGVPRDAYWSWGLYDSLIVVIPSLDLVVARAGKSWQRPEEDHYAVLKPFLQPIAAAVQAAPRKAGAPCPPSTVLVGVNWAPAASIVRRAPGSDNWPLTWGDDGHFYGAYGDGNGFAPHVPEKLSLGLARIEGGPEDFRGANVRSATGEQKGDGAAGKKASGLLMVDGVLYMWVRNAGNAQLAWSADRGRTWTWNDWKFTTSFGAPTFLNFGPNYSGARDDYVYVYSHDADSAYQPADRMVLARVPKDHIRRRDAYEFFKGLDPKGQPAWTNDLAERGTVFTHDGKCYRSGISYNPGLKRYLWCQVLPQSKDPRGPRFQGGFGIYEAPEPWGPWATVFYTEDWDVGPGETSSFPTKWMSADGKTLYLVFSGNDCFSVRQAVVAVRAHEGTGR
jgi:CubicO group peptidase (beta-lactamase class C family)